MLYNHKNGHLSTTDFVDMRDAYERYENKDYLRHTTGEYFPPQDLHESCFTPRMLKILEKAKVARQFAHLHHATGDTVMYFSPGTLQTDIMLKMVVFSTIPDLKNKRLPPDWSLLKAELLQWEKFKMISCTTGITAQTNNTFNPSTLMKLRLQISCF